MKKILAFLSMILVVAAGCGSSDSGSEGSGGTAENPTEITFATYSVTAEQEPTLQKIISMFEEQNPDIKVNYEITPFDDYFTKLQTSVAGGQAPDVFELNYENSVTYNENGITADMNDYLTDDQKAGYDQTALTGFQDADGNQFGLPTSFSTVLTYYNKELFDAAGVDYPTDDWTMDDELAAAKALTDSDNGVYGLVSPFSYNEFYKTAAQFGGELFNEDNTVATINDPKNVEALQYMLDLINNGYTPGNLGPDEDTQLFKDGKAAMLTTGSWMFGSFADTSFDWDVAVEAGNTKATHYFANAVAMSKDTKNAEAAAKWMTFYTQDPEVQKLKIEDSWETPAVSDKDVIKAYEDTSNGEDRSKVFASLEYGVNPPIPSGVSAAELDDTINGDIQEAKLGNVTAQEALDKAQDDVTALMQ